MATLNMQVIQYVNTSVTKDLNLSIVGDVTWSTTPTYPNYIYDQKVSLKLGELNDTFSFKIPNINGTYINSFNLQDKIQIYYLLNSATADSTNLIMPGLIKRIEERVTEGKGKELTISGVSFGELMVNGLTFADVSNVTAFEYIQAALNNVKLNVPKFPVTWNAGNPLLYKYSGESGGDQVFAGAAFPDIFGGGSVSYFNKSLNKILERFLNEDYTGDGRYFWYINTQNELVIRKRMTVITGNITEGTDAIVSMQIDNDTSDIRNFIVVKCGNDPAGHPITTSYRDNVSMAQYGMRYWLLKTADAGDLLEQCKNSTASWSSTSMYPPAYPFTCPWKDINNATVTASSDSDFVAKFRTQVKVLGENNGKQFAASHNKGYKRIVLELPPTLNWKIGDIINCTIPSYNLTNFRIRVYEIEYNNNSTILTLKEEFLNSL